MYLEINKILNEIITKNEFLDYYSAISASIPDDIYFQDILNGVWDLSKLYNINFNKESNYKINENNNRSNYKITNYLEYNNNNMKINYNNNEKNNKKYMSKSLSTPEIMSQNFTPKVYYNNNIINNILLNNNNNINLNDYKSYNFQEINSNSIIDNKRYNQNLIDNNIENNENKKFNGNINLKSISDPYYRPRISQGEKGIKKFKKIIYNPITKELLYSYNFNDKYNNELNQNNFKENKIKSPMKRYKNNIYIFDEEKYKQQKLIELFNKFRNEIIEKGEKTIFILQKILYEFNTDYHPNLISFDNFCSLFQKLQIRNINIDGIKKIFEIFDKNNIGYIDYDYFFKNLVGYMGRNRQELVRKIYDVIKKDQNGNIFVVDFKKIFNGSKYNEIFRGQKSMEYIYYEFIDNLEIFLNYRNKLYNKNLSNILSYDDFLRFFDQISMYIDNDDTFENYINTCWSVNPNYFNNRDSRNNRKNNNSMIRTGSQIINC